MRLNPLRPFVQLPNKQYTANPEIACLIGLGTAAGRVHVSKCTAGVPPARGRLAGREDEGGRDARGTLWATHLLTCTPAGLYPPLDTAVPMR